MSAANERPIVEGRGTVRTRSVRANSCRRFVHGKVIDVDAIVGKSRGVSRIGGAFVELIFLDSGFLCPHVVQTREHCAILRRLGSSKPGSGNFQVQLGKQTIDPLPQRRNFLPGIERGSRSMSGRQRGLPLWQVAAGRPGQFAEFVRLGQCRQNRRTCLGDAVVRCRSIRSHPPPPKATMQTTEAASARATRRVFRSWAAFARAAAAANSV